MCMCDKETNQSSEAGDDTNDNVYDTSLMTISTKNVEGGKRD